MVRTYRHEASRRGLCLYSIGIEHGYKGLEHWCKALNGKTVIPGSLGVQGDWIQLALVFEAS